MRTRARKAGLLAVALLALASPAAASGDDPAPGVAPAQSGPKDYSRNAATGDFAGAREAAAARSRAEDLRWLAAGNSIPTSSLAGTTSAPADDELRSAPVDNPWPELAIGFVAGCLVACAAVLIAGRTRRSRVAV